MRFSLNIDCDNAAFDGDEATRWELFRILHRLSDAYRKSVTEGAEPPSSVVLDSNGNTVGTLSFAFPS